MKRRKLHPDSVAALVAVILAPDDAARQGKSLEECIDRRREQVLKLAQVYYKVNPCDFDNTNEWQTQAQRNGLNNLAKLNRKNLL